MVDEGTLRFEKFDAFAIHDATYQTNDHELGPVDEHLLESLLVLVYRYPEIPYLGLAICTINVDKINYVNKKCFVYRMFTVYNVK